MTNSILTSKVFPLTPSPSWLKTLPSKDYWSTPFAKSLLSKLDLSQGISILDVACGSGVPSFYLADRVGPTGRIVGIDIHEAQLRQARAYQGLSFPWLEFRQGDVRSLPTDLPQFDRITGNLAFMFFRPHRKKALQQLVSFLKRGGQVVLTFPSRGTFDSLWKRVEKAMTEQGLMKERHAFRAYQDERPSASDASQWLHEIGLERVEVEEQPLDVPTGSGEAFLHHPLLRAGFLDDVFECFADQSLAQNFMNAIADDVESFLPLTAQRCVMSGWRPLKSLPSAIA
ncbi:MAG: class I SAM-dependent methyltransferase [Nitrospirales bacterium]|nr:class I SAM-dependent methyltransferase [Nitrospira sp.]MDR4502461.1 class I SAM-dependent methyltransferase [Nitrospirales bacterium]